MGEHTPHNSLIDMEIGRTATQRLYIDAPLLGVESVGLESSLLAGQLDGVDVLVPAVVAGSWIAFAVLVAHGGAESVEDGAGGDIFRGDEKDGFALALDFFALFAPVSRM